MRFRTFILPLLFFCFVSPTLGQEKPLKTDTPSNKGQIELMPEETEWWQELKKAGEELKEAWARVEKAISDNNEKKSSSPREEILKGVPAPILERANTARKNFLSLIQKGNERGFRTRPETVSPELIILSRMHPLNFNDRQDHRGCWKIVVEVLVGQDGLPYSAKVLRIFQTTCSNTEAPNSQTPKTETQTDSSGLRKAFEEATIKTAMELVFIPFIADHKFAKGKAQVVYQYNIY